MTTSWRHTPQKLFQNLIDAKISLVPRPRPAFQYGKAERAW